MISPFPPIGAPLVHLARADDLAIPSSEDEVGDPVLAVALVETLQLGCVLADALDAVLCASFLLVALGRQDDLTIAGLQAEIELVALLRLIELELAQAPLFLLLWLRGLPICRCGEIFELRIRGILGDRCDAVVSASSAALVHLAHANDL